MNRLSGVTVRGAIVVVALSLAACSGGGPAATGGGGGGGAPTTGAGGSSGNGTGGGGTGANGDLSKVDACSVLTTDQIQGVLGVAVKAGVNQDSDIVRQCEWDSASDTVALSVGVTIRTYTDEEWQVLTAFKTAVAVSGLGDAAYKNSPLPGALSVKFDGYEIDLGIANFTTKSQTEIDQANVDLMKLILPHL